MSGKRLRIDLWLRKHLQLADLHGLQWMERPEAGLFTVNWSHKSANSWDIADRQNNIFLAYSRYRGGRHQSPVTAKDYRQLKQNFRCALRGSRHLRHEPWLSRSRGCEARRVYRFVAGPGRSGGDHSSAGLPELSVDSDYLPELDVDTLQVDDLTEDLPELDVDTDLGILRAPSSHSSGAASCDEFLALVDLQLDPELDLQLDPELDLQLDPELDLRFDPPDGEDLLANLVGTLEASSPPPSPLYFADCGDGAP